MRDLTIAAPFVAQSLVGAVAAGHDGDRILLECGIRPELLAQPLARIPVASFVTLNRYLMRLLQDECLGLLDHPQPPGTFELLTRSVIHERDLGAAIQLYARAANLLNRGMVNEVETRGDRVRYHLRLSPGAMARSSYLFETAAITAHRFFCWLCRARVHVDRVDLHYPAPDFADDYRELFYGAPVYFEQDRIALHLRAGDMALPVVQDAASLRRYLRRAPLELFTPTHSPTVSQQARRLVLQSLAKGAGVPSASEAARLLGLRPQTFWRRLRDEGSDYTKVRTQARRDSAIWMLTRESHSVEQVAEALGFSESSAFVRAFRQWTGLTPLAYRRCSGGEA